MKRKVALIVGVFVVCGLETYFSFLRSLDKAVSIAFGDSEGDQWPGV